MNVDQSSEPRFRILIWENGKHVGTLRDDNASRANSHFGGAVARYKKSPVSHRIELHDGPDLIEIWSSEEGGRYPLSSRLCDKL